MIPLGSYSDVTSNKCIDFWILCWVRKECEIHSNYLLRLKLIWFFQVRFSLSVVCT